MSDHVRSELMCQIRSGRMYQIRSVQMGTGLSHQTRLRAVCQMDSYRSRRFCDCLRDRNRCQTRRDQVVPDISDEIRSELVCQINPDRSRHACLRACLLDARFEEQRGDFFMNDYFLRLRFFVFVECLIFSSYAGWRTGDGQDCGCCQQNEFFEQLAYFRLITLCWWGAGKKPAGGGRKRTL